MYMYNMHVCARVIKLHLHACTLLYCLLKELGTLHPLMHVHMYMYIKLINQTWNGFNCAPMSGINFTQVIYFVCLH